MYITPLQTCCCNSAISLLQECRRFEFFCCAPSGLACSSCFATPASHSLWSPRLRRLPSIQPSRSSLNPWRFGTPIQSRSFSTPRQCWSFAAPMSSQLGSCATTSLVQPVLHPLSLQVMMRCQVSLIFSRHFPLSLSFSSTPRLLCQTTLAFSRIRVLLCSCAACLMGGLF